MPKSKRGVLRRTRRLARPRLEIAVETEIRRQVEGAVMIRVVAIAHVAHGRLRGGGLQRRMRIHQAERGEEAGIRNAPDPDLAVVVGHVLDQPSMVSQVSVLSSVSFGPLNCVLCGGTSTNVPPGHVAAAHVLVHDDEASFSASSEGPTTGR